MYNNIMININTKLMLLKHYSLSIKFIMSIIMSLFIFNVKYFHVKYFYIAIICLFVYVINNICINCRYFIKIISNDIIIVKNILSCYEINEILNNSENKLHGNFANIINKRIRHLTYNVKLNDDVNINKYYHGTEEVFDLKGKYTICIYLSDDFIGGETKFGDVTIKPKKGDMLIFNNNVAHENTQILYGIKYVICGYSD